jgi:hypothetical protein
MQYKIEKLLADKIIEKDDDGDYVFMTTLKIGVVEYDNVMHIIESFTEKRGRYIGKTSTGNELDIEYMDIYSLSN